MEQLSFSRHVILKDRVSIDLSKIEVVVDWSRPTNMTKAKSFLELAGYYRRFVHRFFSIMAPLTKLTRMNDMFIWSTEHELNFHELKDRLTSTQVLALPLGSGGFMIHSDASHKGLRCVLMQQGKVIIYGRDNKNYMSRITQSTIWS